MYLGIKLFLLSKKPLKLQQENWSKSSHIEKNLKACVFVVMNLKTSFVFFSVFSFISSLNVCVCVCV